MFSGTSLLLFRGTWFIALLEKLGLGPPLVFLRRRSRGTLWYDQLQNSSGSGRRERSCCPGRHSLMSTIYRLGGRCRKLSKLRRIASETLTQWGHAMQARWSPPPLQSEFLHRGRVFTRVFTRTWNFCRFCRIFIPVRGTSVWFCT